MKPKKCTMSKKGKCTSDYHYGVDCDGLNISKNCPYKLKREKKSSKLFPSKVIPSMLTDGQGGYYPNDKKSEQGEEQ